MSPCEKNINVISRFWLWFALCYLFKYVEKSLKLKCIISTNYCLYWEFWYLRNAYLKTAPFFPNRRLSWPEHSSGYEAMVANCNHCLAMVAICSGPRGARGETRTRNLSVMSPASTLPLDQLQLDYTRSRCSADADLKTGICWIQEKCFQN